jgi:hypothetical protein
MFDFEHLKTHPGQVNDMEWYFIAVLGLLCFVPLIANAFSKKKLAFWAPITMFSVVMIYYAIVGPIKSIWDNDTYLRMIDHRPYFIYAWAGALLFALCFIVAYYVTPAKISRPIELNMKMFKKQVWICFSIGLGSFIVLKGFGGLANVQFWEAQTGGGEALLDAGSFNAYLGNAFNFLIISAPGFIFLFRKKQMGLILFVLMMFITIGLTISMGFRWRLVIMGFACLSAWYFSMNRKVKIIPLGILGIGFLVLMGIMEQSRSYGKGLDITRLKGQSLEGNLEHSLNESATFQASGLVMFYTGRLFPTVGMSPVIQSLVSPIPRKLWPNKPTGEHLWNIEKVYMRSNGGRAGMGQAILGYGEYYMMYKWWGIVMMALFMGWFFAKTGKFSKDQTLTEVHPWLFIFKVLSGAYLYVVISRGYTPQQFMFYFFTVFPAWYFYKRSLKHDANH